MNFGIKKLSLIGSGARIFCFLILLHENMWIYSIITHWRCLCECLYETLSISITTSFTFYKYHSLVKKTKPFSRQSEDLI